MQMRKLTIDPASVSWLGVLSASTYLTYRVSFALFNKLIEQGIVSTSVTLSVPVTVQIATLVVLVAVCLFITASIAMGGIRSWTRPPLSCPIAPLSQQEFFRKIRELDGEARGRCINFLESYYPSLTREQSTKLINLIFERNFKPYLPNHFGAYPFTEYREVFGFPFIWLLNELETGGVRYLYENNIWQIHWDVSNRFEGEIEHRSEETVKYLVTSGPYTKTNKHWKEHKLIFWSYAGEWALEYPFSKDKDFSLWNQHNDFLKSLQLTTCNQ